MTAYVYTPWAPVPSPTQPVPPNGTTVNNGNVNTSVWGAGIRAETYPIRMIKLETVLYVSIAIFRVDNGTFRNSTLPGQSTPFPLRQGAPAATCTTGMSTTVTRMIQVGDSFSYGYSISGNIPTGTLRYLASAPGNGASQAAVGGVAASSLTTYQFPAETIIQPGSMFWFGAQSQPLAYSYQGSANYYSQDGGSLSTKYYFTTNQSQSFVSTAATLLPTNIYFEEIQEDWFS